MKRVLIRYEAARRGRARVQETRAMDDRMNQEIAISREKELRCLNKPRSMTPRTPTLSFETRWIFLVALF